MVCNLSVYSNETKWYTTLMDRKRTEIVGCAVGEAERWIVFPKDITHYFEQSNKDMGEWDMCNLHAHNYR